MKIPHRQLKTFVGAGMSIFLLVLVTVLRPASAAVSGHSSTAPQASGSTPVTFTFEDGNNGEEGGITYGTPNGVPAFVRDGFMADVVQTGSYSGGLHFHELDSTLNDKVPDRPAGEQGVLWRDGFANQDPLFFKPVDPNAMFSVESLAVGTTSADDAAARVQLTGFLHGSVVGTIILAPPVDGYASYSAPDLGALQGLEMDRLEFMALGDSLTGYYMLDNVVFDVSTNTPPTITVNDMTKEGNTPGGWTLAFSDIGSASDAEDGVPSVSCTPAVASVLPLGQTTVSCTATDSGGLSTTDSGVVTVVDTTPPAIACPADINGTVGQSISLGAPMVSDIVDSSPSVTNNTPATFPAGMTTITWTATDHSGNSASCSQKVTLTYIFLGFYQPVDNPPTVNTAKAGQAIPFKWSLQDANGNFVSDLTTAASYGYGALANCSGDTATIEEYANTGSTSLRYDSTTNQFILTSKTDKSWAGSCKMFTLVLSDGTKHQAKFTFTR